MIVPDSTRRILPGTPHYQFHCNTGPRAGLIHDFGGGVVVRVTLYYGYNVYIY